MTSATERITVLVTPEEKRRIARHAKWASLSMDEFLRRAATAYRSNEGEKVLEGMIEQMNKTAAKANAAIDEAWAFVEASNKRIAAMER